MIYGAECSSGRTEAPRDHVLIVKLKMVLDAGVCVWEDAQVVRR